MCLNFGVQVNGCGKSRLLKVLNICYKSIYTSGNSTEAPIFRLIHKYGGTLIIDEAEFSRRTDGNEGVKEILRFGKDRDGVVPRCDGVNFEVKTYRVFGPKILGSRKSYNDDALESRIINIKMKETEAEHIPLNLDKDKFKEDSDKLRRKLLKWSFDNYFKIDTNIYEKYIDNDVSKRINEMNSSLICVRAWDKGFIRALLDKSREKHLGLMEDKSLSFEANIVKEIEGLYSKNGKDPLLKDVVENLNEEGKRNYSSRFIGNIIRDTLGLKTRHTRDGSVIEINKTRLEELLKLYNLQD